MSATRSIRNMIVGLLWLASAQFYIAQIVVAAYWTGGTGFSLRTNTISDLGNTACGAYGSRDVCSPLNGVMNISFILLGLTMLLASWYAWRLFQAKTTRAGLVLLAISGIGSIVVGLFPENGIAWPHASGAALAFIGGNSALMCMAFSRELPPAIRITGGLLGSIGLVALVLFVSTLYGPLGIGGVERVVAYPQSIWMTLAGLSLLIAKR